MRLIRRDGTFTMSLGFASLGLAMLLAITTTAAAAEPKLTLKSGDHISLIGNTLADRMQHEGWMETLIQKRFPKYQLSFRNLGFAGDELETRPRSADFGSADVWLTRTKADVIFAFFGYNESFAGVRGVDGFKKKLARFIDQTAGKKYNGTSAPQLVLFSPIAHENLNSPHLPDGKEANMRLAAYAIAMGEVAKAKGVVFVDLFGPTQKLYGNVKKSLTINGVHLGSEGNRRVAQIIDQSLFGGPSADGKSVTKLREAVLDKNLHWFNRYRTVDGYNVYGGRSRLNFGGQTNADVMKREMKIFDAMTANRDKRVWAVAVGGDLVVDDSNTPAPLVVKSNRKGSLEGGKFPFLDGVEAIDKMKIAEGMEVNLFASEEQFPEMINPVQMSVGPDGRLWVATWPTYPHWNPKKERRDKIVILPDDNGDGKADRLVVFADNLNSVTGFEFWGGGILVAAAPEIIFLKDTDGDDKADVRIRMLQGVSSADSHHTANSLVIGTDGCLYWSRGVFHVTNMETPTKKFRSKSSGVYRFDPRTYEVNFHYHIGPNPHGDTIDKWGFQFANDGTGGAGDYVSIGHGTRSPKRWFRKRVRPVAATGFISGSHFPEANRGNFLVCNTIGVLGVLQHRVEYNGADIHATEIEPILLSTDPNFRPTDVEIGGDGALYISDWCNPIIGHMQHNIRDPNRDHLHGRVYRVTAKGRPTLKVVKLRNKPIAEVLSAFVHGEKALSYRARLELSGRKTGEVVAAAEKFAVKIQPNTAANEQILLEVLWVYAEHRVPNMPLLNKVFQAKEPRVRAAAIRTLANWGSRVDDWEATLLSAARDANPLVRAEAAKAAIKFEGINAAEAIFEVATRPTDIQLDFVLKYARSRLNVDAIVKAAISSGKKLSPAASRYAFRNSSISDLLKMEPSEALFRAILVRRNVSANDLRTAIHGLAKVQKVAELSSLLDLIEELDGKKQNEALGNLGRVLADQPAEKLEGVRQRLEEMATSGKSNLTRQAGYAAWLGLEDAIDDAFILASSDRQRLRDFLAAVPMVNSDDARTAIYAKLRPLLFELPASLKTTDGSNSIRSSGVRVEYFQPNPPNADIKSFAKLTPKTSSIAQSFGLHVPQGQPHDAFGLVFTGAIYVSTSGEYTFYSKSDDGSRLYLGDKLIVNNDGDHGAREKKGTISLSAGSYPIVVTYYDVGGTDHLSVSWSGPGLKKQAIAGPLLSVLGKETLSDDIIRTLKSIPGHHVAKFQDLAAIVQSGKHRTSAIAAIDAIPSEHWPPNVIRPLADSLVAYLSEIPAQHRTAATPMQAIALAKRLAAKLPADQAADTINRLANLDVRVIAIGTVPFRMIYDVEQIVVQAGKPVEFRFSNADHMPHNFTIVQPGALQEIGLLAEATARDADAIARHYVPKSDKVLLASQLIQPGKSQALAFDVPKEPGIYPYVCTVPGHWTRMYGALYVVADLAAYRADAKAYLAKAKLPIKDELLEENTRGRKWSFDDLQASANPLPQGRSWDVGRQVFKVSTCIACHKLNGEGVDFGADLSKLDPKKKPVDLLRSLLEPSHKIDDKYRSYRFLLDSGESVSGMIVEETDDLVKVIENPLAKGKPVVIQKNTIELRKRSEISIMPQGLVDKLSREEILDLIAYIYAGGNKKHKMFMDHTHHKHHKIHKDEHDHDHDHDH